MGRVLIKYIVITILATANSTLYCQSWSQFGLTTLNQYHDFSAYGGLDRATIITTHIRSQWSQFGGGPSTQYAGVHSPVYIWNGAVGLDIMNQSQGNISLKRIRTSYNFVSATSVGLFSIGGRVGIVQGSLKGNQVITPEGEYEDGSINHNDPVLSSQLANGITPTFEVSAYFQSKKWSSGVSIADLPSSKLKVDKAELGLNPVLSTYFNYFIPITYNIDLQASILVKSDFINMQGEVNAIAKINGNIFGGLLFRGYSSSTIDAMGLIFGHSINKNLSMFYSYDFGLNDLQIAHQGSHELLIKYRLEKLFGTGLPPKITYNPRFL